MATGDPPLDIIIKATDNVSWPTGFIDNRLRTHVESFDEVAMDGIAERLWKKMFDFPVLVVCAYCKSVNAVTNGTCLHCNGPLGNAEKYAGAVHP